MAIKKNIFTLITALMLTLSPTFLFAKADDISSAAPKGIGMGIILIVFIFLLLLIAAAIFMKFQANEINDTVDESFNEDDHLQKERLNNYIKDLTQDQLNRLDKIFTKRRLKKENIHKQKGGTSAKWFGVFGLLALLFAGNTTFAQFSNNEPVATGNNVLGETGVIITIVLVLIPVLVGIFLLIIKVNKAYHSVRNRSNKKEAEKLAEYIAGLPEDEVSEKLIRRQQQLNYKLKNNELGGDKEAEDKKGLIAYNYEDKRGPAVVATKKRAIKRPAIDPKLSKLVLWYIITATIWLVLGTSVGEYLGIKFVSPDADHLSWLSFGRLRPVHTNSVFWGWASLGMFALLYYAVPRVGNNRLYSYKLGWISLILMNAAVFFGDISLMAGLNNGGGEYREYVWPIMGLFIIAVLLTLYNALRTIAMRKTREIYISNWYIVSALMFGTTIMLVAYLPFWQNGLGETIVQGYYMHQGVGMWFMMMTLGFIYYYLPQQMNRPIYSYSLGILAFWSQILFYTLIGSHHFVFSPIPWWLQTVAIIGSIGMIIPVATGTTNFLMTFRGGWYKLKNSYTLPFFLVGIIFYFTGSLQGTAEAFRSTNLMWHFTDFTVAHSHMTMYGIITFLIWACSYAVVPRLTGKEPPQVLVGAHFWLALIGVLFYTVPLMIGGTLKGLDWMAGKPFIDGVIEMAPYWLWRAIGGSLMWLSHIIFAYNLYKMYASPKIVNIKDAAIDKLAAA